MIKLERANAAHRTKWGDYLEYLSSLFADVFRFRGESALRSWGRPSVQALEVKGIYVQTPVSRFLWLFGSLFSVASVG